MCGMGPGGLGGQPIVPCGKRQVSAEEVVERDVCGPSEGETGDHM